MRTLLLILLFPLAAFADGGAILSQQTIGGLQVTVFGSPAPLRAGPVDVSVLVQEAGSTKTVLDAKVDVSWEADASLTKAWLPPCCSMTTTDKGIPADLGHAQNKLLYSAIVPIASAGPSKLVVRVDRGAEKVSATVDIDPRPPQPPLLAYWQWLAFPPLMVIGFALRQRLVRRHGSGSAE